MTKDEMKNRISMALKDPILQQGFEIICKENTELKKVCEETQELLDKQIEATYKLDKENAELKGLKDVATLIRANNDTVTTLMQLNNMLVSKSQQLTNGKEIIKKLKALYFSPVVTKDDVKRQDEILAEAEQFLNSEVEK